MVCGLNLLGPAFVTQRYLIQRCFQSLPVLGLDFFTISYHHPSASRHRSFHLLHVAVILTIELIHPGPYRFWPLC